MRVRRGREPPVGLGASRFAGLGVATPGTFSLFVARDEERLALARHVPREEPGHEDRRPEYLVQRGFRGDGGGAVGRLRQDERIQRAVPRGAERAVERQAERGVRRRALGVPEPAGQRLGHDVRHREPDAGGDTLGQQGGRRQDRFVRDQRRAR